MTMRIKQKQKHQFLISIANDPTCHLW